MPQFNSLKAGINAMMPKSDLQERFDNYVKNGFSGRNVDKWNKEIEEIESQMPFKDDEEHKKWSDMGASWMGEPEWLDMTKEIISRKTDSAKPNKGAIINTVGDTVAESIPNAPKKDNSMPVPRRN